MTTPDSARLGHKPMLSFSLLRGALALCLSTATLALLPTAPALAQAAASAAAEPDTSVLSDTLTYDDIAKQTIYKGNIIEQGKHNELLAKGGFYAELYNSQFAGNYLVEEAI